MILGGPAPSQNEDRATSSSTSFLRSYVGYLNLLSRFDIGPANVSNPISADEIRTYQG